MVLALDAAGRVAEVSVSHPSDESLTDIWQGQMFAEIVSAESQAKIATLFKADAGNPESSAAWRHVNLIVRRGESVPLLMKFAHLPEKSGLSGLILARDLRPSVELSERFRQAALEMERRYEALVHDSPKRRDTPMGFEDVAFGASAAGRMGASLLTRMVEKIDQRPLGDIVSETVRVLERLCITEALSRSQGGEAEAARLLGLTVDELRRKMLN